MIDETADAHSTDTNRCSNVSNVRLPGEKCHSCRTARVGLLKNMKGLFSSTIERFSASGGKTRGMVLGVFGGESLEERSCLVRCMYDSEETDKSPRVGNPHYCSSPRIPRHDR